MRKMKICLLSNFRTSPSEGMMNVADNLYKQMSYRHSVLHVNWRKIIDIPFLNSLRKFKPQVIHLVLRPSSPSLSLALGLKTLFGDSRFVLTALQPMQQQYLTRRLLSRLEPDLVLVQSSETEDFFKNCGCKTVFFPSGVDTSRFVELTSKVKHKTREKFGIDPNKFLVLHVGHMTRGRNLEVLGHFTDDCQVLVVSSPVFPTNEKLLRHLQKRGLIIWRRYFSNIEEIYGLSDCYIFPTANPSYSIEMPLSVLEAMSCNIPVITWKFGALSRVFAEGDGLIFVDGVEDAISALRAVKSGIPILTRKKVQPYDWAKIVEQLECKYLELL